MRSLVVVLSVSIAACGGSNSSPGSPGGGDSNEPLPKCELNVDCPQGTTPFCVEGICLQVAEIPSCSDTERCPAGYHCSADNLCEVGCEANLDCCPTGEDCACPDGSGCDLFECITVDGRCRSDATVCTDCPADWQCLDTAPECYLAGLCYLPADCTDGQICIDNACAPCTADEQCTSNLVCSPGGKCVSPAPQDTSPNRLCATDSECSHVTDGFCSTTQNPQRCTKTCSNNGQCRSDDFDSCNNQGECE